MCGDARIAQARARSGSLAGLAVALALIASPVAPAAAAAADWQGPVTISPPGNATSVGLAVNAAGDVGALSWDNRDGGRLALTRKPAGGAWSTPVTVAVPLSLTFGSIGIDGAGNVTVVYTYGATDVVTWPAGETALRRTTLASGLSLVKLAIDDAGDAVLVGTSVTNPYNTVTVGYRTGAGGEFALRTYAAPGLGANSMRAAINGAGTAVVVFESAGLKSLMRTASGDWPALPETVEGVLDVSDGGDAVGIDDAGNALVAFTYDTGTAPVTTAVRTAHRPAATGIWVPSGDLSAGAPASVASLSVAATGNAVLAWQYSEGAATSLRFASGTSLTGTFTPGGEIVADGGYAPVVTAGAEGGAAVAWNQVTATGGSAPQARVRTAGTWGPTRTLMPQATDRVEPFITSVAADAHGSYAALGTVDNGVAQAIPLTLWFYDAVAPVVAAPAVSGAMTARAPLAFSVTASDVWSAVAAPEWSFGDGTSGTGGQVTHAYAEPGTYRASVSVTDGGGNATVREIAVVVTKARADLTAASFGVRWKRSRAAGTLRVAGRVPLAGTYVAELKRGSVRVLRASVRLAAGSFVRKLKLPARLIPGAYRIRLLPEALPVSAPTRTAKLTAPGEGVVDTAFLSGSRTGAAARGLTGSSNVWATFHFAARASSRLRLTWYITTAGVRRQVRTVVRAPSGRVRDSFAPHGGHGTITAVLQRTGRVVAQASATLR
jgi:PKD repeat protein